MVEASKFANEEAIARDTQADAVRLEAIRKVYGRRRNAVLALDGVTIGFERSRFTAVMGPSGSGKSTLLNVAAGLDRPTSGSVVVDGTELTAMTEAALTRLRRERIGFVFQAFNLLPALTVYQNIALPARLAGHRPDRAKATRVIESIGLGDRRDARPAQLSGGEQQRVAIGRALVSEPAVIFADEPTGSLDTATGREVLALLPASVHEHGRTVGIVTHDPLAASYSDRVVFLADGRFVGQLRSPTAEAIAGRMTHLGAWRDPSVPVSGSRDA